MARGPHECNDHRREQVGGDGQARTLWDVVHFGDQLESHALANHLGEDVFEALARALEGRRNHARSDHARLEQAEVIVAEVEEIAEFRDVFGALEIDAGQAEHRLRQHADVALDRRLGGRVALVHAQVHGDVEHPRALGIVHSEEENVRPTAVAEIEADGRVFGEDGEEVFRAFPREHFRADAKRMRFGVADAEHPLIAPAFADAAANLVEQGLKGEMMVGLGQGAEMGAVRALLPHRGPEPGNGRLETAPEQIGKAVIGQAARFLELAGLREMESKESMQKEGRPDPLVEILRFAAETFEGVAAIEQFARAQ